MTDEISNLDIEYVVHTMLDDYAPCPLTLIDCSISIQNAAEEDITIGRAYIQSLDVEYCAQQGALPDLMQKREYGHYAYTSAIFDFTGDVKKNIRNQLKRPIKTRNYLAIDRIEIIPEYRSLGLSEVLISEVTRLFSAKTNILAIRADPLQFRKEEVAEASNEWVQDLRLDELSTDRQTASTSLKNYFSRQGFADTNRNHIMVRHIDGEH